MGRMWRVITKKIEVREEREDPEQIIEETIFHMQEQLVELRRAIAEAIATQNSTIRELNRYAARAKEWRDRAMLALEKGNEELARVALERRQPLQKNVEKLVAQRDEQQRILAGFYKDLRYLENQINLAKARRNSYKIRSRSELARKKIAESIEKANVN